MVLIINGKIFNISRTNIDKLKKASSFFCQELKQGAKDITFNSVSCNDYLNKFFQFIDGEKLEIADNELFEILEIAMEWKCNRDIIDSIFQNIIIQLTNVNKSNDHFVTFVDKSAEKLPELIKHMTFMLIPIEIISKLFESRFACLPSQINIAKFVTRFFDVVGISAISFVHYIDPKILPQLQIDALNKKFEEFNCLHLFPEFQIHIPNYRELKNLTYQCEIARMKNDESDNKLKELNTPNRDIMNLDQNIKDIKNAIESKKKEIVLSKEQTNLAKKNNETFEEIAKDFVQKTQKLKEKSDEQKKYKDEYDKRSKIINDNKKNIRNFKVGENDGLYAQMKNELSERIRENEKNEKIILENEEVKNFFIQKKIELEPTNANPTST